MAKHRRNFRRARYALKLAALQTISLLLIGYVTGIIPRTNSAVATTGLELSGKPVQASPTTEQTKSGWPVRLVVDELELDLKVSPGKFDTKSGTWTISDTKAYYAIPTPLPNDRAGTTLIYGHNDWRVFNILHLLDPGDTLRVYTKEGLVFHYVFKSAKNYKPTDATAIRNDGPPRMILQTCTGNWNEWRRLFTFELTKVKS